MMINTVWLMKYFFLGGTLGSLYMVGPDAFWQGFKIYGLMGISSVVIAVLLSLIFNYYVKSVK